MKIINSIKGLALTLTSVEIFDAKKCFKGKRVAVIGGADSAFHEENGDYIDNFDIVIRINRGPHIWNKEKAKFFGTKTDIWFHNFFENNNSGGGGPLDIALFQKMGMKYLINPRSDLGAYRRTFNFYRKYKSPLTVYHLPKNICKARDKQFGEKLKPTIGFAALYSALNSECKELYITGFTFWKTPYAKGYRDHVLDMEENKKHFKKQGIHNAELEYNLFKRQLKTTLCTKVILDKKLTEILRSD